MEGLIRLSTRLGAAAVIGGIGVNTCLFDVPGGYRAVVFDRFQGVMKKTYKEGTHPMIPFLQVPVVMDVRTTPRVINSVTGTKDLQMVNISLRVLSRPLEDELPEIYRQLGVDFNDRVLPSLGNEVLKAVVAQYNAEELLSKRAAISKQIRDTLTERAKNFNLILDDVAITHLTFGREFTKAIEHKQVAQQDAERQRFLVQKADQERQASIIRAEGEAEAASLISGALKVAGNGLIEVRRIDTAKEVAEALASSRNVTYLPANNNMLLNIGGKAQ
mmetsp:Transcript_43946/g.138124  ORF Transcript_43946/g.138124 Transcript_43946/m.138124 type:complete len:275 (-) Transcript_43946:255-1079(-)|eukprot:CAMPEP_0118857338 /NCGR_PEP_ID=MMETSP1163-20130328/4485_1 /TAXON_ID=124430 /ORGANISM="Phaeomonas parva, Strain CCMP2877" /LENGTH=274 /DNA_ID=CAMNT_0006790641 /DNA_START=139 /DNA_END=963 /DNA_ORIENTATION=+